MSKEDRLAQLLDLTQRLTAALAREVAAFEAHRPQDAAPLAPETARLTNLYRHETARLRQDQALMAGASETVRAPLLRATEAFQAVLARHGRAVAAAKTVTEGLVEAIAREVAGARTSPAGYGASGRAGPANFSAVTLNRRA